MKHRIKKLFSRKLMYGLAVVVAAGVVMYLIAGRAGYRSGVKTDKGLLSLNVNQAENIKGGQMQLLVTAVDMEGKAQCQGRLKMTISGPQGNTELTSGTVGKPEVDTNAKGNISTVGTATSDFKPSPSPVPGIPANFNCESGESADPTHVVAFKPQAAGVYTINLENTDSGAKVSGTVEVSEKAASPFDVRRNQLTHVKAGQRYPMIITLTAQKDFSGRIGETLPSGFNLAWQGEAKVDQPGKNKGLQLTWEVDIKAGTSRELKYEYVYLDEDAKLPKIMTVGPVDNGGKTIPNTTLSLIISK